MFDSICIGRPGSELDSYMLGQIAESLLFYGKVYVVVNHKGFETLARICGVETLLGLIADEHLQLIFQENRLGVATSVVEGNERHSFIAMESGKYMAQQVVVSVAQELSGRTGKGRRLGNRICDRIVKRRFDPKAAFRWVDDITESGRSDLLVAHILKAHAPGYPVENVRFRLIKTEIGYRVDSSVNFEAAARAYRSNATGDTVLTPAWILTFLYEGHENLLAAAEIASEIGSDPLQAVLAQAELEESVMRAKLGIHGPKMFQEELLNARSVGDAIASGQRNFDELRKLIDEAREFRTWVRGRDPNSDLVREYVRACTSVGWAEKLPNKLKRFALFNAIGTAVGLASGPLAGAGVGLGISAVDTFLVDRLVSGWKPSQFVAGPLASFVSPEENMSIT
ncbi:MAG: hypothetical protein IPJ98_20165 [Bryobacterales bacterium]|nr:hypothetical protein [Bryobacterales bacterium]